MSPTPDIVVVGGLNVDQTARVESLPAPGETVTADGYDESPGGKGAPCSSCSSWSACCCSPSPRYAAIRLVRRRGMRGSQAMFVGAALLGVMYALTAAVPTDFTGMTPYVATLVVLALGVGRLRPPSQTGRPFRRTR